MTGIHISANSSASYGMGHLDQMLLDEEENASRITVRLSLWVVNPNPGGASHATHGASR